MTDVNPQAANRMTASELVRRATDDVGSIFVRNRIWRDLAKVDIRSKYRRTFLGPWWITASHGLFALTIGAVSGSFLGADMRTYLPYFITGITIWNFVSGTVNESLRRPCWFERIDQSNKSADRIPRHAHDPA